MSRQPRRAAQAAQERMQQPYFDPAARGSDEEESDEDGSSASGEEEEEPAAPAQPLSAYEEERLRNIASNQAELVRLGLAPPSTAPRPKRRPAAAAGSSSGGAAALRAATAAGSSSGGVRRGGDDAYNDGSSASLSDDEGDDASRATAPGGASSVDPAADAGQLFRLLVGEGGLLQLDKLASVTADLNLDFSQEDLQHMISLFDSNGQGALGLDDFTAIVRAAATA